SHHDVVGLVDERLREHRRDDGRGHADDPPDERGVEGELHERRQVLSDGRAMGKRWASEQGWGFAVTPPPADRAAKTVGAGWSGLLTRDVARTSFRAMRQVVVVLALVAAGVIGSGCNPKYPACKNDEDCNRDKPRGEFCVNQLCQKCRNDKD